MNIELKRTIFSAVSTIGEWYINGKFECSTLEPPIRKQKPRAIPLGTYRITLDVSPRFKRIMPHLNDVPGFTGVLVHWGNFAKDTLACILVGSKSPHADQVDSSRVEFFDRLFPKLAAAHAANEPIWITISGEPHKETAPPVVAQPVAEETQLNANQEEA